MTSFSTWKFGFEILFNYQLVFSRPSTCFLFNMELASPGNLGIGFSLIINLLYLPPALWLLLLRGYLGFGCCLIINLFASARLCTFLFYVELASSDYLDFRDYKIINLFSPDCLDGILFSVELRFPGYLGVRVNLIINLLSLVCLRVCVSPGYLVLGGFSIINVFSPARLSAFHFNVKIASPAI